MALRKRKLLAATLLPVAVAAGLFIYWSLDEEAHDERFADCERNGRIVTLFFEYGPDDEVTIVYGSQDDRDDSVSVSLKFTARSDASTAAAALGQVSFVASRTASISYPSGELIECAVSE